MKKSYILDAVQPLDLTENVCALKAGENNKDYTEFLSKVGDGKLDTEPSQGHSLLPCQNTSFWTVTAQQLMSVVLAHLEDKYADPSWPCSGAIICPTNAAVEEVNTLIIRLFPSQHREHRSSNSSRVHQ